MTQPTYRPFRGLDPFLPVRVYRRHMPHWRQDGATYFVTFRLGDSVPRTKLEQWRWERRTWYEAHGLSDDLSADEWQARYQQIPTVDREELERRMARTMFIELDKCHGACVLRNRECSGVVGIALRHFHGDRCQCGDFVVMPNHVHWLLMPVGGHQLEDILESVKRYTAVRINAITDQNGNVWQREGHDRIVRDSSELARTRRYIRLNPEKARLGENEYLYHQAEWLTEE